MQVRAAATTILYDKVLRLSLGSLGQVLRRLHPAPCIPALQEPPPSRSIRTSKWVDRPAEGNYFLHRAILSSKLDLTAHKACFITCLICSHPLLFFALPPKTHPGCISSPFHADHDRAPDEPGLGGHRAVSAGRPIRQPSVEGTSRDPSNPVLRHENRRGVFSGRVRGARVHGTDAGARRSWFIGGSVVRDLSVVSGPAKHFGTLPCCVRVPQSLSKRRALRCYFFYLPFLFATPPLLPIFLCPPATR